MRYVAAALLLSLAGNEVSGANIQKILASVGIDCNEEQMEIVVKELEGKNINDLIAAGKGLMGSVPAGAAATGAATATAPTAEAAPAAEVKEEKKKEESDDGSDDDMGFGLFD